MRRGARSLPRPPPEPASPAPPKGAPRRKGGPGSSPPAASRGGRPRTGIPRRGGGLGRRRRPKRELSVEAGRGRSAPFLFPVLRGEPVPVPEPVLEGLRPAPEHLHPGL